MVKTTLSLAILLISPKGKLSYGTLISSLLDLDPLTTLRLYDGRGADEGEIGSDKTGLLLPKRRKQSLVAQESLVLLTDVAHNLLARQIGRAHV